MLPCLIFQTSPESTVNTSVEAACAMYKGVSYFSTYLECPPSRTMTPPLSFLGDWDLEVVEENPRLLASGVEKVVLGESLSSDLFKSSLSNFWILESTSCFGASRFLGRRGCDGGFAIHSTAFFTQVEQGRCPSHLTFLCWQFLHECPRVILLAGAADEAVAGTLTAVSDMMISIQVSLPASDKAPSKQDKTETNDDMQQFH